MAIAYGGISSKITSDSGNSPNVSGSDTMGFVCYVGETSGSTVTGITWNGVAMTKIVGATRSGDRYSEIWYIVNPTAGVNTISISKSSGTYYSWYSLFYTGCAQTGQPDSSNSGTATSTTTLTLSTTIVASNCWTLYFTKDGSGGRTYTVDVGAMRANIVDSGIAISDSNGTRSTGSQSTTHTTSPAVSAVLLATSFAPAVTASGPASLKTLDTIAKASVKTINGIAIASVKTFDTIA